MGGEAGSETEVLLSNGVRADVPLRPVIQTMEGHGIVLMSPHMPVVKRDVGDCRYQIAGCTEEVVVGLLGKEFMSPKDLTESSKGVASKCRSPLGELVEVIHQFDEQEPTNNSSNFASIGGSAERMGMRWRGQVGALSADNGWMAGVAEEDGGGAVGVLP